MNIIGGRLTFYGDDEKILGSRKYNHKNTFAYVFYTVRNNIRRRKEPVHYYHIEPFADEEKIDGRGRNTN